MSETEISIVAIDGGASRCRLVACDSQGMRRASVEIDAHASLTLGVDEAWDHVRSGLDALAFELGMESQWVPKVLSMGLAGALQQERCDAFLAQVPAGASAFLVTDGMAQLHGAAGVRPGICLAVGTGSVLHWKDTNGAVGMAGGWGFPAGDEASGAWLGFRLLQRFLWHRDGDQCESFLMKQVEEYVGETISDIQRWTTSGRSREYARLAPAIVSAAELGDPVAGELLARGACLLDRLLLLAPEELPIYLVGGLSDVYRNRLSNVHRVRLREPVGDVFDGLFALATRATDRGSADSEAIESSLPGGRSWRAL